ncbi:AEC family transporter [Halioxenophilus sp. WMMB6]|uniref:AEC family transporter n=1 Tax=Halioxenophilus sp. WMMB6 TaxID=3073815 RepID=UPI00295EDE81|nr:AEC family transporter [Halioxenophilus sp. WMMB6]
MTLEVFRFALSITAPIFIVLFIGTLLMRLQVINDAFVASATKLVFNVTLPALLFLNIVTADVHVRESLGLVGFGVAATLVIYLLLELIIPKLVTPAADRGVVIQGSFRSNMGIIGLAYCVNAYGEAVYSTAAVYLAIVTIAYNVLSVITLTRWLSASGSVAEISKSVLWGVAKNPLIIAIAAALLVSAMRLPIPPLAIKTGNYFAQMTLPLALLCAGASLSFKAMGDMKNTLITTIGKLLVAPLLITLAAVAFGFQGMELGTIFLMSSAPSASVSYVMARAMGGNATLAANAIVMTTLLSLITTSLGAALLRAFQLS